MRIGISHRVTLVYITFVLILISFVFIPSIFKSPNFVYEGRCDACHIQAQNDFINVEPPREIKCTKCHAITEFNSDLYTHKAITFNCVECSQKELFVEGHPYEIIVGRPPQWMSITVNLSKSIYDIKVYFHRYDNVVSDMAWMIVLLLFSIFVAIVLLFIKYRGKNN